MTPRTRRKSQPMTEAEAQAKSFFGKRLVYLPQGASSLTVEDLDRIFGAERWRRGIAHVVELVLQAKQDGAA